MSAIDTAVKMRQAKIEARKKIVRKRLRSFAWMQGRRILSGNYGLSFRGDSVEAAALDSYLLPSYCGVSCANGKVWITINIW